jgi:preprotein translocase subunit SecF
VELESIRNTLIENGYPDSQVVNFGTNLDVLIKVADQNGNSSIGEAVYLHCLMKKVLKVSLKELSS